MVAVANTAEGGVDETTVTTLNSGGASGRAWDTVTVGPGATMVYDSAVAAHGGLAYRIATGGTSAQAWVGWTGGTLGALPRYFGRCYFMISAGLLGSTIVTLMRARAGATQSSRVSVTTGNKLSIRNTSNGQVAVGAVNIAADTWYRAEWDIAVGAAADGFAKLFLGDSTSALDNLSAPAANFGASNVDEVGFGVVASAANHGTYWVDDLQVNDSAMPGPPAPTIVPAGVAVPVALGPPTVRMMVRPNGLAVPVALGAPAVGMDLAPVIIRPDTSTLTRPDSGVLIRPDTSVITRP